MKHSALVQIGYLALLGLLLSITPRVTGRQDPQAQHSAATAADERRAPDKRLPDGATELPVERYFAARAQMEHMPRYATATDSWAPSRSAAPAQRLPAWTPLGPGNIGGRTRALLLDPRTPDTMYAAGVAGGVWKTTNAGGVWRPLTDQLLNLAVSALALDPSDSQVLYAGTGEGFFNADALPGAGIFKTTDGGANWTRLAATATPDFQYVNDIIVSPNNAQRVYAATRTGVWRSTDGGATWAKAFNPPPVQGDRQPTVYGGCLDLVIRTDRQTDFIFAACGMQGDNRTLNQQGAIYRNQDAAGTGAWTAVLNERFMLRTALALAPSNQNIVYAVSSQLERGNYQYGLHSVFRSTASGEAGTWTAQVRSSDANKLNTVLLSDTRLAFRSECGQGANQFVNQGEYANVIAVDPVDPNRVWVGGVDLFRSDDGGVNWGLASYASAEKAAPQFVRGNQHVIVFHPQYDGAGNRRMFAAGDGGLFRTDDARAATASGPTAACAPSNSAVTWTPLNNNYAVTQFSSGTVAPDGATYVGGTAGAGIVLGADASGVNGWREILSGEGGSVVIDQTNPNIIYAALATGPVRKSTDGGATFSNTTGGSQPFTSDASDPQRLCSASPSCTSNGGARWNSVGSADNSSAVALAPTDSNLGLTGSRTGSIRRFSALGADNLPLPNVTTTPRTGFVSSLVFDPRDKNIAYATYASFNAAATDQHVYRSTDAGATWRGIDGMGTGRLPDIPVHSLVVDPGEATRLYIGTDLGVFVTLDGGATWAVENTGFANVVVEALVPQTRNGVTTLYAFTRGRGVWRVAASRSACSFALAARQAQFEAAGGEGRVDVLATSDCRWAAVSNAAWLRVIAGRDGIGNRTVTFAASANQATRARLGTLTIAGRSFTVTQAGAVDPPPPTIAVTAPSAAPVFTSEENFLNLAGVANDPAGLSFIRWSKRCCNGAATGTTNWTIERIPVQGGVNDITVEARSQSGKSASVTVKAVVGRVIAAVAGNGTVGFTDNRPATAAQLDNPSGIALDAAGNLFIADTLNQRIRRVAVDTGLITTVAGGAVGGFGGDGGPATAAQLNLPRAVAFDAAGNLFIADTLNHRIRRVGLDGVITTVAGAGVAGFSGDGGAAMAARLNLPTAVALDRAGNLFIADSENQRIRRVSPAGVITTVAGGGDELDGPATAARLLAPVGVATDAAGDLFIADRDDHRVRKVTLSTGLISTVLGSGVAGLSGDGRTSGELRGPTHVAVDAAGNLLITDAGNRRVRRLNAQTRLIATIAGGRGDGIVGDSRTATQADLKLPAGLAVDARGDIYLTDTEDQRVFKLTPFPVDTTPPTVRITMPTTAPTFTTTESSISLRGTASDNIGVVDRLRYTNDREPDIFGLTQGSNENWETGGRLYSGVNRLTVTAFDAFGNAGSAALTVTSSIPLQTLYAGFYVFSSRGDFSGDGGPALAARLARPQGLAVDAAGNLYLADSDNLRIRRVTREGVISTYAGSGQLGSSGDGGPALAASLNEPTGLALDAAGNLYIADTQNHRIRRVAPNGVISTVAGTGAAAFGGDGGQATAAQLNLPRGVAVDAAGNLFIADAGNHRLRRVALATGVITTVAGTGAPGFSGDNGPATAAQLNAPTGIATDAAGNLYIADRLNRRVRRIAATTGVITTVAGGGTAFPDNRPATEVNIPEPQGVAVDTAGNLFIAAESVYRVAADTGRISIVAFGGAGVSSFAFFPAVAADGAGNIYLGDTGRHQILLVTPYQPTNTVSAAGLRGEAAASEALVATFGTNLATTTTAVPTLPLPTQLGGVLVKIRDSLGVERLAPLLFVSPTQINHQIPAGTALGTAQVFVLNERGRISAGALPITAVAPGLFTANADGEGVAAAVVLRIRADGAQRFESAAVFNAAQNRFVAEPIDLGPATDQVFLVLFGTGLRGRSALSAVTATIGDRAAPVSFAGPQGALPGLDQVNLRLPRELAGRGVVTVALRVDNRAANLVQVSIR